MTLIGNGFFNGQRQRLMEQIGADLNNTLLYVYRALADAELEEFATFAESAVRRDVWALRRFA